MWANGETRNFVLWQLPARTHGFGRARSIKLAGVLLRKRKAGDRREDTESRQRHFRGEQSHFFLHSRIARAVRFILHCTRSAL